MSKHLLLLLLQLSNLKLLLLLLLLSKHLLRFLQLVVQLLQQKPTQVQLLRLSGWISLPMHLKGKHAALPRKLQSRLKWQELF
jgi:hypothetical protein